MASPLCAAGTHWLTIIVRRLALSDARVFASGVEGQSQEGGRAMRLELVELLRLRRPDPRSRRRCPAAACAATRARCRHAPASVAGKILRFKASQRRVLPVNDAIDQVAIVDDGVDERRHVHRILVRIQNAGAVHRRGHRRRRVGEHRHAHVKRFDQRHAEALVLAGRYEDVGDLVVGRQLFVRDVADEVHVAAVEAGDEFVEHAPRSARIPHASQRAAAAIAD